MSVLEGLGGSLSRFLPSIPSDAFQLFRKSELVSSSAPKKSCLTSMTISCTSFCGMLRQYRELNTLVEVLKVQRHHRTVEGERTMHIYPTAANRSASFEAAWLPHFDNLVQANLACRFYIHQLQMAALAAAIKNTDCSISSAMRRLCYTPEGQKSILIAGGTYSFIFQKSNLAWHMAECYR